MYLSIHPSVRRPSVHSFAHWFIRSFIYPFIHPRTYQSIHPSFLSPIHASINQLSMNPARAFYKPFHKPGIVLENLGTLS